jgi:hypothetical protein
MQVIMATNRIDSLDPALIRPGRIDRKIEFPLPDEKTKRRIFGIHTGRMTLAEDVNLEEFVMAKDDLSGADIKVPLALRPPNRTRPSARRRGLWLCASAVCELMEMTSASPKKAFSTARTRAHRKDCICKQSIQ